MEHPVHQKRAGLILHLVEAGVSAVAEDAADQEHAQPRGPRADQSGDEALAGQARGGRVGHRRGRRERQGSAEVVELFRLERSRERPTHELDAKVDDRRAAEGLRHQGRAGDDDVHASRSESEDIEQRAVVGTGGCRRGGGSGVAAGAEGVLVPPVTIERGSTVDPSPGFPVAGTFVGASGTSKASEMRATAGEERERWMHARVKDCGAGARC